jgi:hypothetical protein
MHKLTGKEIEKRAVMEVINYIESRIDELIRQSNTELQNLNDLREKQCLVEKKRIDDECIKRAIKTLRGNDIHNGHRNGGAEKKEGVKHDKHTQNEEYREVEIA